MVEVTAEEFDLLKQALLYDPKKRITPENALKHPYFSASPERKRIDMKEAQKQRQEWDDQKRQEREANNDFLFFKKDEGEGGSSFAMRLAQFLSEEDDTFKPRSGLFEDEAEGSGEK